MNHLNEEKRTLSSELETLSKMVQSLILSGDITGHEMTVLRNTIREYFLNDQALERIN